MLKRIVCADGFTMSVQASTTNYSEPRDDRGPYVAAEVGFPSYYDMHLAPYAEDSSGPPDMTVYGWVPAIQIRMCIDSHGGMVSGELPEFTKESWEGINV